MSTPIDPAPSAAEVKERLKDSIIALLHAERITRELGDCKQADHHKKSAETLTSAIALIERGELERERLAQLEKKLNHFTDATTKPHSLDDATMREWDLANELAKLRALLAEVKEHHARGLEHVKNQERTLTEYAKEVADLRAQLAAATERVKLWQELAEATEGKIYFMTMPKDYYDDEMSDKTERALDKAMARLTAARAAIYAVRAPKEGTP